MKKHIRNSVFILILYMIFLLVLMPADRVYAVLKDKITLPVSLYQIHGSVWHGNAAVAMIQNQRLEAVAWQLKPWALLLGRLQIALGFDKNSGSVKAIAGRSITGQYFLRNVAAELPASEIEPLISSIKLGLAGNVVVEINEIRIEDNRLTMLDGSLAWKDAGIMSSAATTAGSFEVNFETTAQGIKGIIKDTDGPLQANGILLIKPDGSYQLTASFVPRDATRNDLKQALRFLGNPGPTGKVTITRSGNVQLEKYLPFVTKS